MDPKPFQKTCTDNLKIQPIYRWLNEWVNKNYFPDSDLSLRKQALYAFTALYGKIRMLIGISKGEEKRAKNTASGNQWMDKNIERVYPLLAEGIDRQGCQDLMAAYGLPVPPPSLCIFCPFKDEREVLLTALKFPLRFARWVELEANKLQANLHKGKDNHAVFRARTLPQVVADAKIKYSDWTVQQLEDYSFSHGHCVASGY